MESIVSTSLSAAPPIKILDVTWADWLNNVPNKICYQLGNYCFIKIKYYHYLYTISSNNSNLIVYNIPKHKTFTDQSCIPIGECIDQGISGNVKYLEGFVQGGNQNTLGFYLDAGILQPLTDCMYLNIDYFYEIEE